MNPLENRASGLEAYHILLTAFIACLAISQVLATKIVAFRLPVAGELMMTGGVVPYALTFLCTDVTSEIWGRRRAAAMVLCGLIANLLLILLIQAALALPAAGFWHGGDAFASVMGSTSRIIFASLIAYIASQYHDVWLFHLLKRLSRDRLLWIRNNVSTVISQTIDTAIFVFIAFYGTAPMLKLMMGVLVAKWIIAALDTPLIYLTVWIIRRGKSAYQLKGVRG